MDNGENLILKMISKLEQKVTDLEKIVKVLQQKFPTEQIECKCCRRLNCNDPWCEEIESKNIRK